VQKGANLKNQQRPVKRTRLNGISTQDPVLGVSNEGPIALADQPLLLALCTVVKRGGEMKEAAN
jgi:hypothetical protein